MESAAISMILGGAIVAVAGYALTKPLDIRGHRWPCILLSIPLVCLVINVFAVSVSGNSAALGPGIGAILAIAGLAFVWKDVFSHYTSGGVMRLITGNLNANSGITPDLRLPKWHRKEGRIDEAIQVLHEELEKDEFDYEALVLLTELHEEKRDVTAAHVAITKLFHSGRLAGVQIDMIEERKKRLEEKVLIEQLNARK